MGSGLKLLIAGMIFGVVAFFAFIGVTKTIKPNSPTSTTQETITLPSVQSETTDTNAATDTAAVSDDNAIASDTPQDTASNNGFEIVGENNDSDGDAEVDLLDPANTVVTQDADMSTDTSKDSNTDSRPTTDIATTDNEVTQSIPTPANTNNFNTDIQNSNSTTSDSTEKMASLAVKTILASNDRPVNANIYVQKPNGENISRLNNTPSGTFSLPEGQYKITARFGDAISVRNISLNQEQTLTLTLRLADPKKTPPEISTGTMQIVLKSLDSNTAIKGNIYIQLPNGRQVTNQNYIDKAEFTLDPGTYKVTAKAPGKADLVRNLTITKGEAIRATFEMQAIEQTKPTPTRPIPNAADSRPVSPPVSNQANNSHDGTIYIRLQNSNERARFVVRDQYGEAVARERGVANTHFTLAPGIYDIIASQPRSMARKTITLAPKQTLNITFLEADFSAYRDDRFNQRPPLARDLGNLQLHAISGLDGRPLAVNFTVTTLQGAVLGNYNNVTNANLSIPPQDVLVLIHYETMQGQERITVRPNEPTTYTFTISPN